MKQLTCFLLLLTVSFHLLAQKESPVADGLRKEYYLRKTTNQEIQQAELKSFQTDYLARSKKQRTAGWILTGTGMAVTSIGLMLVITDAVEEVTLGITSLMWGEVKPEPHPNNRGAILLTGSAMVLTGTTFLIISKKNKKKALSMSFINESSQQLRYNTVMNTSVPSVRLRLQF